MSALRRRWFELTAGLICFAWAFAGWLTVIPNQDILANAIQAQSLLHDPRIVLAFPGQKHGGPLELPFLVLAEAVAPGNYYTLTLVSLGLAFLTGFVTALLYLRLVPTGPRWSFLVVILVGPTIIHGMLGPQGNPVGVWWLQPNWDVAWLAVAGGALVIARLGGVTPRDEVRPVRAALIAGSGGLLVGLGFFAHPAIILLIIPLVTLVILRVHVAKWTLLWAALGGALGVAPAAVSYVVNAGVNTWDPSHGPFFLKSVYLAALGLDGIPDYMVALLPYSIGLAPSNGFLDGSIQSVIMWVFLILVLVVTVVGLIRAARNHERPSLGVAIAASWLAGAATIVAFATFVDPVWIYSSGLSILFWISAGALPAMLSPRWVGNAAVVAVVAVVGASTLTHNAEWYGSFGERMHAKSEYLGEGQDLARALHRAGARFVYGSYYDAITVGYASGYSLRTVTNHYNRFPITEDEAAGGGLLVAVNAEPTDGWGEEAVAWVEGRCSSVATGEDADLGGYRVYRCPSVALVEGTS